MSHKSRNWCYGIKSDTGSMIERVIQEIGQRAAPTLGTFFSSESILVPAPRSTPIKPGAHWAPRRICEELQKAGYGKVENWLVRSVPVVKSATAGFGGRPEVEDHVESIDPTVEGDLYPRKIVVVDDVVTRGATLYACAAILKSMFPNSEVKTFAVVRTMGLVPEVQGVLDPRVGRIAFNGSKVDREP